MITRLPIRFILKHHHLSPSSPLSASSHLHHHHHHHFHPPKPRSTYPIRFVTTTATRGTKKTIPPKMPSSSSSLPPSFTLTPCTPADIPLLSPSYYDCFIADKGITHWFDQCPRSEMESWMRRRLASRMAEANARHYKVVDHHHDGDNDDTNTPTTTQDSLVAWARWALPEDKEKIVEAFSDGEALEGERKRWAEEKERQEKEGKVDGDGSADDVPKGADAELMKGFLGKLDEMEKKWGADDMLTLGIICTDPKYRRRGAAAALLKPMLDIADSQGLPSYLEATPIGRPLYEKFGFRTVDDIVFDLTKLTGGRLEGVYTMNVMIRDPQPPIH